MLDQSTKKKIDNARDILVGKVPDPKSQVEQITIALIYKFMDDMDKKSEEWGGKSTFFTGDYEKYAWSKIFDPRLGGFDLIALYADAIVKMNQNPNIPQLFRDIFKNAYLPYRDPETLKSFLKEINEFTYDHSEQLGDAFEYLLSVMDSQGDAGQFRTPRHIIDFIVEIVAPKKNETVLDPACGTAGFLISSYKHILKANTKARNGDQLTPDERKRLLNNFMGYDISPDMVRLSLVNLYLHGFSNPKIVEYDTLTSEERWNETADVMLANPPFMTPKGGIRPHKRFSIQAKRSEVLFVDYIAENLNPHGRAGVIVPEGIIFQSQTAYKNLRKMLVEDYLWAVVSLPPGVFNPYSGVKTSILLMDKSLAKKTDSILFVKIENDGFNLGAQRRSIDKNDLPKALGLIKNCYKAMIDASEVKETDFSHVALKAKIAKDGDWLLSWERYRSIDKIKISDYKWLKLGKVFKKSNNTINPKEHKGNVKYIGLENIESGSGRVIGNLKIEISNIKSTKTKFKKGDILYGKLRPNLNKVFLSDFSGICSTDIYVLRSYRSEIEPKFYSTLFMGEKFNTEVLKGLSGSQLPRVGWKYFSSIQIPLPPLDVQKAIVEEFDGYQRIIDGARLVVDNYKPTIKIDPDWEIVPLEEVCHFKRGPFGGSLKKEIFVKDGFKVYEQKHAIRNDFEIGEYYITEDKYKEMFAFALMPNDLIISCSGTMGKIAIVPQKFKPGIINQALLKLTPIVEKIKPVFVKVMLENDFIQNKYFRNTAGAAIQNVASVKVLKNIKIPLPPLPTQQEIVAQIEEEQEIVNANKKLIQMFEQKIKDKISEVWGE